jgi:hypothetical protein
MCEKGGRGRSATYETLLPDNKQISLLFSKLKNLKKKISLLFSKWEKFEEECGNFRAVHPKFLYLERSSEFLLPIFLPQI